MLMTNQKIVDTWRALSALSRTTSRFVVSTTKGYALVHYFLPASGLSIMYDENLKMDMGVVFYNALIGEAAVS